MKEFSVVMAFRDTPREREFAIKAIPSITRLNPSEFVIGVDFPANKSFLEHISKLCKKSRYTNYNIVQVKPSLEWNFHLAHIVWECYNTCKYDKIFACDVDTTLRSTILKGYDIVGNNNIAVVSFTKKLLIKNISHLVQYIINRISIKYRDYVFTGNYWIYKPYYFDLVDQKGFQKIYNGVDSYMVDCISNNKSYKLVTLKEIGVNSLDLQNEDYPWRQFQLGIWMHSNEQFLQKQRELILRSPDRCQTYKSKILRLINKRPVLFVLIHVFMHQHPWVLRGYMWAKKNSQHEAVSIAYGKTLDEWCYTGAQHIKNIRDWKKHGRLGTGFN